MRPGPSDSNLKSVEPLDGGRLAGDDLVYEPPPNEATGRGWAPHNLAADEPLPDDYYVTLHSISLDLIETQLRRLGWHYTRRRDQILASWETFITSITVNVDMLLVRVRIRQAFELDDLTSKVGRCNTWNARRTFMKASCFIQVASEQSTASSNAKSLGSVVHLDFDLPCEMGIAPVQLQALLRAIIADAHSFTNFLGLPPVASVTGRSDVTPS